MRTRTARGRWPGVRPPRFRRDPFVREVALDLGRASASRIAAPHMLPSTDNNGSAPAIFSLSRLNPTPHTIAVCASPLPSPADAQHSLAGGRYPLPAPDFHRLDRASFAWRTLPTRSSLLTLHSCPRTRRTKWASSGARCPRVRKRGCRHKTAVSLAEPSSPMRAAHVANVGDGCAAILGRPRHAPPRLTTMSDQALRPALAHRNGAAHWS
jgi:hypothetical protein